MVLQYGSVDLAILLYGHTIWAVVQYGGTFRRCCSIAICFWPYFTVLKCCGDTAVLWYLFAGTALSLCIAGDTAKWRYFSSILQYGDTL